MRQAVPLCGLFSIIIFASSLSCAQQHSSWSEIKASNAPNPRNAQIELLAANTVAVVDENNQPVPGASVLLGFEDGNPFPGNTLTTDSQGAASVPADWKAALPLTVQAPGFITSTIPIALPGGMTVQISHQEAAGQIEVKGDTTDFGHLRDDGKVHFSLVMPAISRSMMLGFDMSTILSPQTDPIDVFGKTINIPSNVTLPDQTATYIFPIHFNKPTYRTYLRNPGTYRISATHGLFPLQRVVGDIRAGKSIFDVINYFNFIEGGSKDVVVQGNVAGQDISVHQNPFTAATTVKAPNFPANNIMLSLGMEEQNGLMTPTDLKRLTSGQSLNLKATSVSPSVLSLLMIDSNASIRVFSDMADRFFAPFNLADAFMAFNAVTTKKTQDFSRLSFALLPAAGGVAPQFLPLTDTPTVAGNVFKLDAPVVPVGLTAVATYMVLSEIETLGTGKVHTESRTRIWEIWSGAFLQQVELPKIAITRNPNRKYRWDVMFLARPASFVPSASVPGVVDLSTITHVTRNALEI